MSHTFRTAPIGSTDEVLISRFSIVILSSVLIGMGLGTSLHPDLSVMCGMLGLAGLAMHVALSVVAHYRYLEWTSTLQESAANRLQRHRASEFGWDSRKPAPEEAR